MGNSGPLGGKSLLEMNCMRRCRKVFWGKEELGKGECPQGWCGVEEGTIKEWEMHP